MRGMSESDIARRSRYVNALAIVAVRVLQRQEWGSASHEANETMWSALFSATLAASFGEAHLSPSHRRSAEQKYAPP